MELNVNIVPQSYLPEIRVSKNDNTMRTIKVNLIDENCDPWTPPAGASAVFTGTKPSGLGFTLPCTISGSAVTFTMLTTACNEDGRFLAEVRFTDGNGGRIGSCNVMMNVEWDPHPDDTTDGDEEELINEITALLEEIREEHQQAIEDITDAKGDALDAITEEHQDAVQDINNAKDAALDAIQDDVQAAADSAAQAAESERITTEAMDAWTNMSAEAVTLPAGSDATASYSDGLLSIGVPKGDKGDQGAQGEPGQTGATPDLQIGTVETLDPGEDATATITGTPEEPILSLGIPQGEKGDPGDVSMEQLLSLAVYDEASGEIASFPDGSDGFPMKSLKVTLEPVQNLHGYDKPWPGGAGKNKFDNNLFYVGYSSQLWENGFNSVNVLQDNNGFKTTVNASYGFGAYLGYLSAGVTYTISFSQTGIAEWQTFRVRKTSTNQLSKTSGVSATSLADKAITTGANYLTFTADEDCHYWLGLYDASAGSAHEQALSNVQLELGTSATDFEPYENICPITGWDEVSVTQTGIDWSKYNQTNGYTIDASGNLTESPAYMTTDYIPVENNQTIYFGSAWNSSGWTWKVARYDANKAFIDRLSNTVGGAYDGTANTGSAEYVRVSVPYLNVNCYVYSQKTTYSTDLGQTVYGGTVDLVSGVLTVTHQTYAVTGSETFSATGSGQHIITSPSVTSLGAKVPANEDVANLWATFAEAKSYNSLNVSGTTDGIGIGGGSTNKYIIIGSEQYGVWSNLIGELIVYELATPQAYQLTPTEVDTLLGTNNVWSDGDVYVKYVADTKLYILKVINQ